MSCSCGCTPCNCQPRPSVCWLLGFVRTAWFVAFYRKLKNFLNRKFRMGSAVLKKGMRRNSSSFTGVRYGHLTTRELDPNSSGVVSVLFRCRNPLAVFFTVISIYVLSFNSVSFGALPHISNKAFEVLPFRADLYTPPTVSFESLGVGVITPCIHCHPCRVGGSKIRMCGESMERLSFCGGFTSTTPTGAFLQGVGRNHSLSSTRASCENQIPDSSGRDIDDCVFSVSLSKRIVRVGSHIPLNYISSATLTT